MLDSKRARDERPPRLSRDDANLRACPGSRCATCWIRNANGFPGRCEFANLSRRERCERVGKRRRTGSHFSLVANTAGAKSKQRPQEQSSGPLVLRGKSEGFTCCAVARVWLGRSRGERWRARCACPGPLSGGVLRPVRGDFRRARLTPAPFSWDSDPAFSCPTEAVSGPGLLNAGAWSRASATRAPTFARGAASAQVRSDRGLRRAVGALCATGAGLLNAQRATQALRSWELTTKQAG